MFVREIILAAEIRLQFAEIAKGNLRNLRESILAARISFKNSSNSKVRKHVSEETIYNLKTVYIYKSISL